MKKIEFGWNGKPDPVNFINAAVIVKKEGEDYFAEFEDEKLKEIRLKVTKVELQASVLMYFSIENCPKMQLISSMIEKSVIHVNGVFIIVIQRVL